MYQIEKLKEQSWHPVSEKIIKISQSKFLVYNLFEAQGGSFTANKCIVSTVRRNMRPGLNGDWKLYYHVDAVEECEK